LRQQKPSKPPVRDSRPAPSPLWRLVGWNADAEPWEGRRRASIRAQPPAGAQPSGLRFDQGKGLLQGGIPPEALEWRHGHAPIPAALTDLLGPLAAGPNHCRFLRKGGAASIEGLHEAIAGLSRPRFDLASRITFLPAGPSSTNRSNARRLDAPAFPSAARHRKSRHQIELFSPGLSAAAQPQARFDALGTAPKGKATNAN